MRKTRQNCIYGYAGNLYLKSACIQVQVLEYNDFDNRKIFFLLWIWNSSFRIQNVHINIWKWILAGKKSVKFQKWLISISLSLWYIPSLSYNLVIDYSIVKFCISILTQYRCLLEGEKWFLDFFLSILSSVIPPPCIMFLLKPRLRILRRMFRRLSSIFLLPISPVVRSVLQFLSLISGASV